MTFSHKGYRSIHSSMGTHWANPKIMSSAYKCRSNLPKQVVGMARIGNTHDMTIIFNATKHQNVWANMPKNPEGLKCQRRQYLMFNFDPKNLQAFYLQQVFNIKFNRQNLCDWCSEVLPTIFVGKCLLQAKMPIQCLHIAYKYLQCPI